MSLSFIEHCGTWCTHDRCTHVGGSSFQFFFPVKITLKALMEALKSHTFALTRHESAALTQVYLFIYFYLFVPKCVRHCRIATESARVQKLLGTQHKNTSGSDIISVLSYAFKQLPILFLPAVLPAVDSSNYVTFILETCLTSLYLSHIIVCSTMPPCCHVHDWSHAPLSPLGYPELTQRVDNQLFCDCLWLCLLVCLLVKPDNGKSGYVEFASQYRPLMRFKIFFYDWY